MTFISYFTVTDLSELLTLIPVDVPGVYSREEALIKYPFMETPSNDVEVLIESIIYDNSLWYYDYILGDNCYIQKNKLDLKLENEIEEVELDHSKNEQEELDIGNL